jgi:hypothetical protein
VPGCQPNASPAPIRVGPNLLGSSYKLSDPRDFWDGKAIVCMRTWPKFSENFGARFQENDLRAGTRKKRIKKIIIDFVYEQ